MSHSRPFEILLIEDDPNDSFLIERAFKKSESQCILKSCYDGAAAIAYLAGKSTLLPDLIITDIHMPKVNGHELLEWIRSQPSLQDIPVVVMSSSKERIDVDRAMSTGAKAYLQKPLDQETLFHQVRTLLDQWGRRKLESRP